MSDMRQRLLSSQRGVASLLFSMVMMIVISLIVLSFAQVARNGQRNTLDNQLSTQAFFAAETGVNDVTKRIKEKLAGPGDPTLLNNNNCTPTTTLGALQQDLGGGVSYSCVKVNVTPLTQVFNISPSGSKIVNLRSNGGITDSISSVTIRWPASPGRSGGNVSSCPSDSNLEDVFTAADAWSCPYALVRADIISMPGGTIDQATARSQAMGLFAVPTRTGLGIANEAYAAGARRSPANCNTTTCSTTIRFAPSQYIAMRIMSKYMAVDGLTISAQNQFGSPINFAGGQAIVDVTGRAQDVSRRIQVRVPLTNGGGAADYALQTTDSICKQFEIQAGSLNDSDDCPLPN